ncbi:MAG: four helix bundle protein [Clostridia bacterium]|nr:four helix bundle protein [Clostridia bacterium]
MADSILREKSKVFAKDIVFLFRELKANGVEGALINQLIRCGTSVGANIHEAQYAQGTKDFISKLEIALKECNESEFWLSLLFEVGRLSNERLAYYNNQIITLRRMLVSSITTLKEKQ